MNTALEEIHFENRVWLEWLISAEQAVCKHESAEIDSCIGPESGIEDFYCPDCGKSEHIVWY